MKTALKTFVFLFALSSIFSCTDGNFLGITISDLEIIDTVQVDMTTTESETFEQSSPAKNLDNFAAIIEAKAGVPFEKEKLDELKFTHLALSILEPETGNFNWAESVELGINGVNITKDVDGKVISRDTLPYQKIIDVVDFPVGSVMVDVPLPGEDITEALKSDLFFMSVKTKTDEIVPVAHQVKVVITYSVKVKP